MVLCIFHLFVGILRSFLFWCMSTFSFCNHLDKEVELEFRYSNVSPSQAEVKQGKFVEFISCAKGYLRETYKPQNIKK